MQRRIGWVGSVAGVSREGLGAALVQASRADVRHLLRLCEEHNPIEDKEDATNLQGG